MKIFNKLSAGVLGTAMLLTVGSCQYEQGFDPNNPSLASVLNDANKSELQVLVTGLEARHRGYYGSATQMFGSFGREVWAYFGSDPRFQTDWLGIGVEPYVDFFASAGTYVTPYVAVKQANVIIDAATNSSTLTDAERNGYTGFAKTIKAYQLIWPWLQQWENGIRIDVSDPLAPGPFLTRTEALTEIRAILDEGFDELSSAGDTFSFSMTDGFTSTDAEYDFSTPARMAQINRAIAARFALYAEDYTGAITALGQSFYDEMGDFGAGPRHVYGEGVDINNPLYYPQDRVTNTILLAHPGLIEDAEAGDARLSKFFTRTNTVVNTGIADGDGNPIAGVYQDNRYPTNVSPIAWIRNEELILINAEAQLMSGGGSAAAIASIDAIRTAHGLPAYSGATDNDAVMDEILHQRRYSLWAEGGHRWIDLRRTGNLNETYIDLREGGSIFTEIPRRSSETNWDNAQGG